MDKITIIHALQLWVINGDCSNKRITQNHETTMKKKFAWLFQSYLGLRILFSVTLWLASLKKTQFWHSGRFSAVSADELALLMNHFIQCVFFCPRARKACARVSRWGLSGYDAFVCLLIGSCLSLLSVTSQARKAELGQSEPSIQIARPDKEQLAAGAAHAFLF